MAEGRDSWPRLRRGHTRPGRPMDGTRAAGRGRARRSSISVRVAAGGDRERSGPARRGPLGGDRVLRRRPKSASALHAERDQRDRRPRGRGSRRRPRAARRGALKGFLNQPPIIARLEHVLGDDGVPVTADDLALLRRLRNERNLALHGSAAAPDEQRKRRSARPRCIPCIGTTSTTRELVGRTELEQSSLSH